MRDEISVEHDGGIPTLLLAVWALCVVGGLLVVTAYSGSPGPDGRAIVESPKNSRISLSNERSTLVVFLHPRCPCSRATVNEIRKLVSGRDDFELQPVFYRPGDEQNAWVQTDMWSTLESLGTRPSVIDIDGEQCRLFGVTTSGHVILFSAEGQVLYSGGMTGGRGHEGENNGLTKLTRVLDGASVSDCTFPVYGCPIIEAKRSRDEN